MYVLDTNVLVAALWSQTGASYGIVKRVLSGRLKVAVSVALALEYEAVLKRALIREASWATSSELDRLLDDVLANSKLIAPIRVVLRPTLNDPSDDMVLECAVQSRAKAIITMNLRDFEPVKRLFHIEVLKPGELMARLRKEI